MLSLALRWLHSSISVSWPQVKKLNSPSAMVGTYFSCILYSLKMTPDKNDLDLDFFCRQILRADLEDIRQIACPNSDLGIPGAVEKDSLVGYGVVVDAGRRLQATLSNPTILGMDQLSSDPNATLVGRQQGTST
jgi:hypothetical protein